MTHKELLRLTAFQMAQKLHYNHSKRVAKSKSAVRGLAKALNLQLKNGQVHSLPMEKLHWSPWKYKSIHPEFKGQTKAS